MTNDGSNTVLNVILVEFEKQSEISQYNHFPFLIGIKGPYLDGARRLVVSRTIALTVQTYFADHCNDTKVNW